MPTVPPFSHTQRARIGFLYAVPIGTLGGLIGLGGAEFRLPVLAGPLGYAARSAVPLNLAISLITVAAALITRGGILSFAPLGAFVPVILGMISGAMITAFLGATLATRISSGRLERIILWLLLGIGGALIIEAFLPQEVTSFVSNEALWQMVAGAFFGLGIGLVSSLLGVAGGELIIPTLLFAFGADIVTAGTASLIISLPVMVVGIARYAHRNAYQHQALSDTVAPMGLGSVIGAILGGLLVGFAPTSLLKLVLGCILIASAWRTFGHAHLTKR